MQKVIFNWSSGKDSAFALYKTLQDKEIKILYLLTSISAQHKRVSMHGVRVDLLEAQAESIGLELIKMMIPEMPTMEAYEKVMNLTLQDLIKKGAVASVFGDIFLEDLRQYREKKLAEVGMQGLFPLWNSSTDVLIQEIIKLGFKCIVTCVSEKHLDKSFAGRTIDQDFLDDLPEGVDPCGENGEFHTFVYDGPIFKNPIPIEIGEIVYRKYTPVKQKEDSGYDCEEKQEESGADPFEFGFWYCDILLKKSDKLASFNSL